MKFRNKTNQDVSINITPLIDVVFLLLIFFMVSTTFKHDNQLNIELPQASLEGAEVPAEVAIYIAIGADGQYELNGQQYTADNLHPLYQVLLDIKQPAEAQIFVVGDKNAPHQSLVTLLEMSADAGISKVRILAQNKEPHLYQTAMK